MYHRIIAAMLYCSIALIAGSCVEPFELPDSAQMKQGLLVIDGSLNVESGTGRVILSRTQPLNATTAPEQITDATVKLESESGETFQPSYISGGVYHFIGRPLRYDVKYRLRVTLSESEIYLSEYVSTGKAPEIDDITWKVENDGVQLYVNTHDPENDTRYYRWEFEETYEYNTGAMSEYEYKNGAIRWREVKDRPYICWRTDRSSNILIGSSIKLTDDVISEMPITFQPNGSKQLSRRYSILVKQYAISKEEYRYWELLKQGTENVGSLFDAQPSQVTGNFSRLNDAEEPVLGFFTVNSMSEKRMFISALDLKPYKFDYKPEKCEIMEPVSASDVPNFTGMLIISLSGEGMYPEGPYTMAPAWCADCRTFGGSLTKPAFW